MATYTRPAKTSKIAKTRKVLALARSMGATVRRTSELHQHVMYLVLPVDKVWVASGNRELWIGGASYGSPSGCADIDIAMLKVAKGVKTNE